jgi:acyl carrier protein
MSTAVPALHQVVVESLARVAKVTPESITPSTNLLELGLNSLDFSEILVDVEDAVGDEIPPEVLDRLDDVGDVVTVDDVFTFLSVWTPKPS